MIESTPTTQNERSTRRRRQRTETPLSTLIAERMKVLGLAQNQVCRASGLDQALLSKMASGDTKTATLETLLKLAIGLQLEPETVFEAAGRKRLCELLSSAGYTREGQAA